MKKCLSVTIMIILIIMLGLLLYFYKEDIKSLFFKEQVIDNNNNNINENNDEEENKEKDPYEKYKKISNFKLENLNRYIAYKENNQNLSLEDVITYVNIGLDYEFYSYISDADITKGNLILMNKYLKLADDYEPNDLEEIDSNYFIYGNERVRKLRKDAKEAFEKMCSDALKENIYIYGQSAYRPYLMQETLYNNAVSSIGKENADNDTARPGHSEHQTGLAIDVSSTRNGNMLSFENTSSFDWMMDNAYKYGFILRYTKNYENIHGFIYEPWHYRYVGVEVATNMYKNYPNMTYDEYYYKFIEI